jgi:hypothetical protein
MKTRQIINCNAFVIPNSPVRISNYRDLTKIHSYELSFLADLSKIFESLKSEGLIPEEKKFCDEEFIQMWFATPGNPESNWVDHKIDGYPELEDHRPISMYLPKSLFNGYVEGNIITFNMFVEKPRFPEELKALQEKTISDEIDLAEYKAAKRQLIADGIYDPDERVGITKVRVSMKLDQSSYRYRDHGKFEEVINR